MTPKLRERLERLERTHAAQADPIPIPRELVRAWLWAIAVALGGYPQACQPAPSYRSDNLSDGFARGLGYADRDEMDGAALDDPDDWRQRIERAHAALRERYKADAYPEPSTQAHHLMCSALDTWAGAKAGNPDWPQDDDDSCLARALAFYGVEPEAGTAGMRP